MKKTNKVVEIAEVADINSFFISKLMERELPFENDSFITNLLSSLQEYQNGFGPNITEEALNHLEKIRGWLLHMAYLLDD